MITISAGSVPEHEKPYFPEEKLRAVFFLAGLEIKGLKPTPCEYCNCCPQNNWWLVETEIGTIKVGWRKRVINMDFGQVPDHPTSEQLTNDEVTKGDGYIHAWGYPKLACYLEALKTGTNLNKWRRERKERGEE